MALRDDAPALALRGIAMAQLADYAKAKLLLRAAARAFGVEQPLARARCVVAEAEVALASRDLAWNAKALAEARDVLERHGDRANAVHARYLEIRRHLLLGRLADAERNLLDPDALPPSLRVVHELAVAGIAIRRIAPKVARAALLRAERAARYAGIPALWAEVDAALRVLDTQAARRLANGEERAVLLDDVEALFASQAFVVDACRLSVRQGGSVIPLASRPVLLTLVRALAAAWPGDVTRDALVARAFRLKRADEASRARLRVEIGRLRRLLRPIAAVSATADGFAITPHRASEVVVLTLPVEEEYAPVLALLSDGEAWSSSALSLALGTSQRTVQRALDELLASGKVRFIGRGRARRWLSPLPGFTTALLLPASLSMD